MATSPDRTVGGSVAQGDPVDVGSLVGGEERRAGEPREVEDPGRLDGPAGRYWAALAADVDDAVAGARSAQREWAGLPVDERATALLAAADAIERAADRLGDTLARETGAPRAQCRGEALGAARHLRTAAELGPEVLAARDIPGAGGGRIRLGRRPFGVVAAIVPWNAPLGLAAQKLGPALIAGNGVVLKPSPLAPLALTRLVGLIAGALPRGLVALVNGDGDIGSALVRHPDVGKVSFTGGAVAARSIMRDAADSLTRVHFELGGNDPAIVLDDADLDAAADGIAASAFRRAGQVCYAVKRVYVPERRAAAFTDALLAAVDRIVVGYGLDPESTMGPVIAADARDRIDAWAAATRDAGREVREAGELRADPATGHYLRPRVVLDAAPDDEIVRVEQFGPLLPIVAVADADAAVAAANASDFGLGGSVWSTDEDRAVAVAERLECGVAFVNAHVLSAAAFRTVPFGGVKQSGMGWENSVVGIGEYLEHHSVDVHPR